MFAATRVVATRTMSSNSARHMIAVCQLTSKFDLDENFDVCASMVRRAKERNCKAVFFPECFDYVGRNKEETIKMAISENGEFMSRFRALARDNSMWLSLGGFHDNNDDISELPYNTHIVINADGNTAAKYHKLHVFDLDIPEKNVRLMESEFSRAGKQLVPPVQTPVGKLGLGICYDVRFAELALYNRQNGAEILSYPSAFTVPTGLAHWETLIRCRAIETQCYVVAAAQVGQHHEKRTSYGHALVCDPWGAVIAQCSDAVDMCFAEIDLNYLKTVRQNQPVMKHRRSDLYAIQFNSKAAAPSGGYKFSHIEIPASTVFYTSTSSYAFVNLKPVRDGHVLVSPLRQANRLTDLSDIETADLFNTAKKVQRILEPHYKTSSSTVCVQDGEAAGQTVKHVHVHIIPRHKGDFGENPDDLYKILEAECKLEPRSEDAMAAEAAIYRDLLLRS